MLNEILKYNKQITTLKLYCAPGFFGPMCEKHLNTPTTSANRSGNATSVNRSPTLIVGNKEANEEEEEASPCASMPCFNNGTCRFDSASSFTCQCQPGFHGTNCEAGQRSLEFALKSKSKLVYFNAAFYEYRSTPLHVLAVRVQLRVPRVAA